MILCPHILLPLAPTVVLCELKPAQGGRTKHPGPLPLSTALPHRCSCHSCRSTGLRAAVSGSQTPPPRSSGGQHQRHGAGCGCRATQHLCRRDPHPAIPTFLQDSTWALANLHLSASLGERWRGEYKKKGPDNKRESQGHPGPQDHIAQNKQGCRPGTLKASKAADTQSGAIRTGNA